MAKIEKCGFTDEAAREDLFNIDHYIRGLSKFILTCNTPMTISIQGTWGSGKTSMMNMVEENIKDKVYPILFNTWQFSQFELGNNLPFSMITVLLKALGNNINFMDKIVGIAKKAAVIAVDRTAGGAASGYFEDAMSGEEKTDYADEILKLKMQFQDTVNKQLEKEKKEKVVIFVDDLDRLEPKKAVELLEVLKIFLDCSNCVFVLAIDYDVVVRGVAVKYGLNSAKDDENEKGKSFFDKIIQVPFKMPVASYDIRNYVEKCFGDIGMQLSENELKVYKDLIECSIGTNPRSMKRLFNAFLLLTIVVPENVVNKTYNKQLLFSILCLQHFNEKIYNFIVRNRYSIDLEILSLLAEENADIASINARLEDIELSQDELDVVVPFMKQFLKAIDINGKDGIDETEFQNFKEVLNFSTITSSSDAETIPSITRKQSTVVTDPSYLNMQWKNKKDIDQICEIIISAGEKAKSEFRARECKTGYISGVIKDDEMNKTKFCDVFDRKKGFAIDLIAKESQFYSHPTLPEVADILSRRPELKPGVYLQGKSVTMYVHTDDDSMIADCHTLLKACYNSYGIG